jgi:hypothetical protein
VSDGRKGETEELYVPADHNSPVGDEAVKVDVQRQMDDSYACNSNCNHERWPDANEHKDQSNDKSHTGKNYDLNKEYSKVKGNDERNKDDTKSTKEKTRI